MADHQIPSAYLEDGDFKTVFVDEVADISAPTVDELTTPLVDLSDYLTADGFKLTHSQDFADDDREAAAAVGQIPGQEKFTDGSLQVIDNTNRGADAKNDAVEKLTKGLQGYIVRRRGKGHFEPFAGDDVVSVYKVTVGIKTAVAHAANARQMSIINFACDPTSQEETSVIPKA
jgi:hypothetical protein